MFPNFSFILYKFSLLCKVSCFVQKEHLRPLSGLHITIFTISLIGENNLKDFMPLKERIALDTKVFLLQK